MNRPSDSEAKAYAVRGLSINERVAAVAGHTNRQTRGQTQDRCFMFSAIDASSVYKRCLHNIIKAPFTSHDLN